MADLIDAYLSYLRRRGRSDATIRTYGGVLRRLDAELPMGLATANAEELEGWIWVDGRSPAAVRLYRTIVGQFFAWATDPRSPRLDFDPSALLPDPPPLPRRVPRPIPTTQLVAILARAREPYRTWYVLAAYAGLRCCEISTLDREHIGQDVIWVRGKGQRERLIPTHPDVWAAVRDLPPGPVARLADGRRANRHYVTNCGNDHLRAIGAHGVTMHRFRHTFATAIYQSSGELAAKRLLGHASVATTQIYAQVADAQLIAAIAALPRITASAAGVAGAAV